MPTILVTGFEPFGGDHANPSREIAKALDGRTLGRHAVRSAILPVAHEAARAAMARALDDGDVSAVLHVGLAGGRARLALEQVAVNVLDYAMADNEGRQIVDQPCVPEAPAAYLSTLPLREILAALTAEGIPAALSYTAGTYVCNQTLYWTLHEIARRRRAVRAGLIHVPYLPAMVAAHGRDEPSMDLALAVRAVEIALRVTSGA